MKRALCRIGVHSWVAFKYLYTVKVYSEFGGDYPVKELRIYERQCDSCGMPQTKKRRA